MGKKVFMAVVFVFAAIGLIVVLGCIAMWLMHGSMMAGMCNEMGGGEMQMMTSP